MGTLSHEECEAQGVLDKIIVAPWEDFEICYKEIA